MNYYDIVKANAAKFRGDEKAMWSSIESVSVLLEKIKEEYPDLYWSFLRDQHEVMVGHHFNEAYAKWEVEKMHHKGMDGTTYKGKHWSIEQTNAVLNGMRSKIPAAYNEWDFYVALNASYHDFCKAAKKHMPDKADELIIDLAVAFWFDDEDWDGTTKVWDYFRK
ncbi:MAG: hypothetical protein J6A66_07460 [Alistipes sp.]|nr:hypothetical protein [Alistipes sp.]